MGEQIGPATILGRLEVLRAALEAAGFAVRVDRPTVGPPRLRVTSADTPELREVITCATSVADDALWFLWSWGDPICPAVEVEQAVKEIGHVLGPRR